MGEGPNLILLHVEIHLSQHHLLNGLDTLVKNQLAKDVWVYFWTLSFILLVNTSILMPVLHLSDSCSFVSVIAFCCFVSVIVLTLGLLLPHLTFAISNLCDLKTPVNRVYNTCI